MKRFLPFLAPIITLLVFIPILLLVELNQFAKILGVVMVLITTFALRYWLYRANRLGQEVPKVKLNVNDKFFLESSLPIYKGMESSTKKIFDERLGRVLAETDFDRKDHKQVSRDEGLAFAALLTCITFGETYKSLKGKVVVFKEEEGTELLFQGEKPVFFICFEEILNELKSISNLDNARFSEGNVGEALKNFNDLTIGQ